MRKMSHRIGKIPKKIFGLKAKAGNADMQSQRSRLSFLRTGAGAYPKKLSGSNQSVFLVPAAMQSVCVCDCVLW